MPLQEVLQCHESFLLQNGGVTLLSKNCLYADISHSRSVNYAIPSLFSFLKPTNPYIDMITVLNMELCCRKALKYLLIYCSTVLGIKTSSILGIKYSSSYRNFTVSEQSPRFLFSIYSGVTHAQITNSELLITALFITAKYGEMFKCPSIGD